MMRPRLEVAETALRQVADLGYRPSDVRHIVPTHLGLDHAGGISDFPGAAVHIYGDELRAASSRSSLIERSRYRAIQISAVKKWAVVEEEEGKSWFGFSAVRAKFRQQTTRFSWSRCQVTRAAIAASRC